MTDFSDDSRWHDAISLMRYLGLSNYTGMVKFSMINGRIHRRTVEDFRHIVALVKTTQQESHEEPVAHAAD